MSTTYSNAMTPIVLDEEALVAACKLLQKEYAAKFLFNERELKLLTYGFKVFPKKRFIILDATA